MLKPCNTPTLDDMVLGLVKVSEILKAKEEGKLENLSMYGK